MSGRFQRWLCGDRSDHARYVDMHRRFQDAPLFGVAIGGALVLAAFTYGWPLLALPVLGAATMAGGLAWSSRSSCPELVGAVSFSALELNLAAGVLLSGGAASPLLPLLVVPVFTQAVCFRPPVTAVSVCLSAAAAVSASWAARALPQPPPAPAYLPLTAYLAMLGCLSLAARYLATADVTSREEAVIDPLTGLFNRKALGAHVDAARDRARVTGEDVAVAMCDIDLFKQVNDRHGHERGDLVLQLVARRLLGSVRTCDLVHRLGGEEFLVLLPGQDLTTAAATAERLRRAVAADPVTGLPVTISVGVTSSRPEAIDLAQMTREADAALYRAKQSGRDRVQVAAGPVPQQWDPPTTLRNSSR